MAFYGHVFRCKVERENDGTVRFTTPAVGGCDGDTAVIDPWSAEGRTVINYFTVASVHDVLERVARHSGRVLVPKSRVGERKWFGYCEDPEGNRFAIAEMSGPDLPTHG